MVTGSRPQGMFPGLSVGSAPHNVCHGVMATARLITTAPPPTCSEAASPLACFIRERGDLEKQSKESGEKYRDEDKGTAWSC